MTPPVDAPDVPAVIPIPPEPHTVLTEIQQQSVWFDRFTGNAMILFAMNPVEFRVAVSLFAERENLGVLPYEEAAAIFAEGVKAFLSGVIESAAFGEVNRPVDQLLSCCAEVARSPRITPRVGAQSAITHQTHQAIANAA